MRLKNLFTLLAISLLALTGCGNMKYAWGDRLVACGGRYLYIIDAAASTEDSLVILWNWDVKEAAGQLSGEALSRSRVLDDCKPAGGGKHILATSSSGETLLLDIKSRKILFHACSPMAHSAEELPRGRIIVANSVHAEGNCLQLYDRSRPDACLWTDSLFAAHGVVWMEKHKRLYALGHTELRVYSLNDWDSGTPSLVLEENHALPSAGGHDLAPCGKDRLLVTNYAGAFVFDPAERTFTPFAPMDGIHHIKSINYNPETERVVHTHAETKWWTNHIYMKNPDKVLSFDPAFHLYKVRVMP